MNLGQLIGELLCRGSADEVRREERRLVTPKVSRADQVVELLRASGSASAHEVAAALGVDRNNATQVLHKMHNLGALVRSGTRRGYRYSLP